MKIGIANDHGGVDLKKEIVKYLESMGHTIINYGSDTYDRVDYPIYGFRVAEALRDNKIDFGIAVCRSAIGIAVACNKVKGIRCGAIYNEHDAVHAKRNDYVNLIALSGENISIAENLKIIDAFMSAENGTDPVYLKRKNQIESYEKGESYGA